jgi:N12 class adenine-specific DNA methylase
MRTKCGTERRSALDLVEDALNAPTPVIYDETDDSKVINKTATLAAQAKLEEIKAKFDAWVWEDEKRSARLAQIYNTKYNVFRTPKFDGAYLTLPGLSREIEPHAYQKDAVVRALTSPAALFAHNVGLGKTLAAIISGMEMMRLGIAHKALVIVPNHRAKRSIAL